VGLSEAWHGRPWRERCEEAVAETESLDGRPSGKVLHLVLETLWSSPLGQY